ncbi:MAG: Ig-like domain-containing protein [Acidobacteriia bacterium]|nr:Ig-like domain-containing protein [Terriglobia bacterium]
MVSTKRKLQLAAGFTALLSLALAVGCRGFFVNPTLTGVTVGPATPSIQQGKTLQMVAVGTYDDGTTKTLTGNVLWTTSDSNIATVTSTGLVKGITAGSATITATSGIVSGSTSVNITLANLSSITVSPSNVSLMGQGQMQQYTAMGHFTNGPDQDITQQVTWSTNPASAATITNTVPKGTLTTLAVTQTTTVTVTATSGTVFGSVTMTVSP